jgi:hypothetical protein
MLKVIGIDIPISQLFVCGAAEMDVTRARRENHRAKGSLKRSKLGGSGCGETRNKGRRETKEEDGGDGGVCMRDVREQGRELLGDGSITEPSVKPEGGGGAIVNPNTSDGMENRETGNNALPHRSGQGGDVTKVPTRGPAIPSTEPDSPGAKVSEWSLDKNLERRAEF